MEAAFVSAQSAARDTLHPVGRRRLDGEFPATRFQPLNHRINVAGELAGDMIAQPNRQHLRVGDCGFAEAEAPANFSAQALLRAPGEEGFAIDWHRHIELLAQ